MSAEDIEEFRWARGTEEDPRNRKNSPPFLPL